MWECPFATIFSNSAENRANAFYFSPLLMQLWPYVAAVRKSLSIELHIIAWQQGNHTFTTISNPKLLHTDLKSGCRPSVTNLLQPPTPPSTYLIGVESVITTWEHTMRWPSTFHLGTESGHVFMYRNSFVYTPRDKWGLCVGCRPSLSRSWH